jgi:N-acetylglutamate synthase-like GNAT family acetyltransferase
MDHEGAIVGCGGYVIDASASEAALVWGMIRKDLQRMGLGRYLLLFRLKDIGRQGNISVVRVETSQNAALFFQKQGFKLASVNAREVSSGLKQIVLLKRLSVCA